MDIETQKTKLNNLLGYLWEDGDILRPYVEYCNEDEESGRRAGFYLDSGTYLGANLTDSVPRLKRYAKRQGWL